MPALTDLRLLAADMIERLALDDDGNCPICNKFVAREDLTHKPDCEAWIIVQGLRAQAVQR